MNAIGGRPDIHVMRLATMFKVAVNMDPTIGMASIAGGTVMVIAASEMGSTSTGALAMAGIAMPKTSVIARMVARMRLVVFFM